MHEFRIWAPKAKKLSVEVDGQNHALTGPDKRGWWNCAVPNAKCGDDYRYYLDADTTPYPDPRSLQQSHGVHGPSRLYDQSLFPWTDQHWQGRAITGSVIYELHIGTFSEAGTFDGAIDHLDHLVDLGITHIEVMPIAEFAGDRGWGYDGVLLYAVAEPYGGPDGFKRLVDACHAKGLAVILDVVYNHFGPVGNYANKFGPYLTEKYHSPWGAAVNFNEGGSDEVRRFFCDNAQMWMRDYHCDGLRLDAVHEFIDRSAIKFLEQLSAETEQLGAVLGRKLSLIAESDLNDPRTVLSREAGGYGMDAQWSDDFHHALFTILYDKEPGRGYYDDFGTIPQLVQALQHVFVYAGDYSSYRQHTHGRPVEGLSAHHFLGYIQNHDQVGNRALGERLEHLVGMEAAKVAIGLVMTAPFVPMIFMGEEFAASSPFLYFADHDDEEMRKLVSQGRKNDFALFGFHDIDVPDPEAVSTFANSKLHWDEVNEGKHAQMLAWTKQLIHLRRTTVALNDGDLGHIKVEASVEKRWLMMQRGSVRILANLGADPVALPLLQDEQLTLATTDAVSINGASIALPKMSLAILMLPSTHRTA